MALLPKHYLNAVVAIGIKENGKFRALATGFLTGFSGGETNEKGRPQFKIFLVTNRHVFQNRKKVTIRFNLTKLGSKTYGLVLKEDIGKQRWLAHQNEKVDIAAVPLSQSQLKRDGIEYSFLLDRDMAFLETIRKEGITQGDGVFVLGFPMGIAGEEKNYVVVRGGAIARLDDEIVSKEFRYLIDSTVFPGSSGSPVILKPEITSIRGTKAVNKAYVIGVVSGYLSFVDTAISQQTGEPRITFVENSGLASVVPMDFVKETVGKLVSLKSGGTM